MKKRYYYHMWNIVTSKQIKKNTETYKPRKCVYLSLEISVYITTVICE